LKISSVNGRPVNLDINTIDLPITAYASITHRITGLMLCAGVLMLLWFLNKSLASEADFIDVQQILSSTPIKVLMFLFLAPFWYHLVAGIRHLVMDMGIGESLEGGRLGAKIVFILSAILIAITGVWLWGG
jgi:succinate dehydrogenase / fumarate reductase cytochrome b subunit|tara:strand:- start:77302 stop:77694 length:393 start_codon:yes stop_codon:yes gene_type:complete